MSTEDDKATGENPGDAAGEADPFAGWAEALEEQKSSAHSADPEQGGPLSGESKRPFDSSSSAPSSDINMVLDIPVQLSVELGRTKVPIKYILQLAQGSVVELDALAGEPMDVLVNGYLIAQGEVVVVNDKFGIRLTDVVTPSERLRRVSRGQG
ncbi:MAG: flagellar motor switch protein FliN [Burkholderiaceae bacterium]|jgi:flagellar motor switch protein FliN/FliY|nr:flagellar motor switch protein FliN [Burkholderiaceae bacterium]MCO5105113.1 flagellar motor switch protein FliN [Burkholderiaceae bacterium]